MKKNELRIWAKKKRTYECFDDYASVIVAKIRNSESYISSQKLMLYYPLPNEINLLDLLNDNKEFYLPCIRDGKIVPYRVGEEYKLGEYNIPEPINTNSIEPKALDLIIVPALCADENGYRVGYGKGFYDRFIKELNRSKTKLLVPLYDEFIVDDIAPNKFDEKVDIIITEKRTIVF